MRVDVACHNTYMARPPIGSLVMTDTVKFRLTKVEYSMLVKIARGGEISGTLRQLIHDEYERMKGDK